MSAASFRQPHDPVRLAAEHACLQGPVPLQEFSRLAEVFGPAGMRDSEVTAELQFSAHQRGLVLIEGLIEGQLRLQCQRCLQDMLLPLAERFRLALQTGEAAASLPDDFELLERQGDSLVPAELLEDELLLSVPLVARHKDFSDCGPMASSYFEPDNGPEMARPFASLEQLGKADQNLD